jgi:RNA-directed DNA polymerase
MFASASTSPIAHGLQLAESALWRDVVSDDAVAADIKSKMFKRGRHKSHRSGLWHFLFHFLLERGVVVQSLLKGYWTFSWCDGVRLEGRKEWVAVRPYIDRFVVALVRVYLTAALRPHLEKNPYYSRAGRGRKAALRDFLQARKDYSYVFKTDVRSYYASIDQTRLLAKLQPYVPKTVLKLVKDIINPVIHVNGTWHQSGQGIPVGCGLSPILAEFYLADLDQRFADTASHQHFHYQRYADDILLLARSNHALKRGIKTIRRILSQHGLGTRYKKTFVGRLHQVVTYLGYRVFPNGTVGVSRESIAKRRLSELQRKAQGATEEELRSYKKRWSQSFSVVAG